MPAIYSPTHARRPGAPKAKGAVRAKLGCYTCRIRRKKCDEQRNTEGSCQTCVRLRLQCLGFGAKRPEWLRASDKVVDLREKIKKFLAAQGMIKGHAGTVLRSPDQEPSILPLSEDYTSPSTSPHIPTLSISNDERHSGIPHNDYLRGDTDARLPIMQDTDPETYSEVVLYSPPATYTYSLEPSWPQSTTFNLSQTHTNDFPQMSQKYWADDGEDHPVIPSGYSLPTPTLQKIFTHRYQTPPLQHYMNHVLGIQYLHADDSIYNLVWNLIDSSDAAREAACLLANLHRKSTQRGSIGLIAGEDHDAYKRIQRAIKPTTEGDALASLCMVSYFLFSGGQGQWQAFLDSACHFSLSMLMKTGHSPAQVLMSCTDSMRFIIKTSMWFDVLASATLMRRPVFLHVLRSLYTPTGARIDDRPARSPRELSMMAVMGCENRIVLALAEIADLACWKIEHKLAGDLSVPELVTRGLCIQGMLNSDDGKSALDERDESNEMEREKSETRLITSEVFRASALVYLHSVISGDHPQCPEIVAGIANTVKCLERAKGRSTARSVVRSVVFSICICGCLTDDKQNRDYFLYRLQEQETEMVGNCARVGDLMKRVWAHREEGKPVDWRLVMRESRMLLV